MVFGNDDFIPPAGIQTADFLIRPLRTTDVELDYAAVMESKEFLRKWDQSNWPEDDFTLADNLEDLDRHEQEHLNGESYTFTVMNPAETECLGCIYIFPMTARWLSKAESTSLGDTDLKDYEAVLMFWIRQSRLTEGMDRQLLETIRPWFGQNWPFDGLLYLTNGQLEQQVSMFEAAGLQGQVTFTLPNQPGEYRAYT